ncbi:MAG: hypothetical protein WBV55_23245 [Candidatus Sulfotelmatobacter sp.]
MTTLFAESLGSAQSQGPVASYRMVKGLTSDSEREIIMWSVDAVLSSNSMLFSPSCAFIHPSS